MIPRFRPSHQGIKHHIAYLFTVQADTSQARYEGHGDTHAETRELVAQLRCAHPPGYAGIVHDLIQLRLVDYNVSVGVFMNDRCHVQILLLRERRRLDTVLTPDAVGELVRYGPLLFGHIRTSFQLVPAGSRVYRGLRIVQLIRRDDPVLIPVSGIQLGFSTGFSVHIKFQAALSSPYITSTEASPVSPGTVATDTSTFFGTASKL